MALADAAMILAANGLRAGITHMQIHAGDPGAAGTANVAPGPARQPISWGAASADGDFNLAATVAFTGGTAGAAASWISLWSALTGGTFLGRFALTGDTTFNSNGEFSVTALPINGSAS